jgi:hypothetical protein
VRELFYKTHGVRDEDARPDLGVEGADGGVERGEELVGHEHLAARERPHQRRFARVRVAHQGHAALIFSERAARPLLAPDRRELAPELGDSVADFPSIELEGALARALAADAAALPVGPSPGLAEARRDVREARDFDLELGLAAPGVAVEDLDNDARPVEDIGPRRALEVARLARAYFVINDDDRGPFCTSAVA